MAVTRTITQTSQGANGSTLSATYTLTSDEEVNFSQLVPAGTATNYGMTFPHTNVQAVYILASTACTLNFNNNGSPAPGMSLAAGIPFQWSIDDYNTNATLSPKPFAADVTGIYVTNAAATQLDISILLTV